MPWPVAGSSRFPRKFLDLHLSFGLLLQCAENQEKVPDIDSHLHAIGIIFAVGGVVRQFDIGLRRIVHTHRV